MSLHLRRLKLSVRTKKQFLAGTNSRVRLSYEIGEDQADAATEAGWFSVDLDRPLHDDFQPGKIDDYEVELGQESSGRQRGGVPVPPGLEFADRAALGALAVKLEIDGSDQWILDRLMLLGDLVELRLATGTEGSLEAVDHDWVELARHSGDVALSTDPGEGTAEFPIAFNGRFFQP